MQPPDASHTSRDLAAALATAADPAALLPDALQCAPLDLLIALHEEVRTAMLSDLPRARRAGEAAAQVAARVPNDALAQAQAAWTQGSALLYVPDYAGALAHYDAALAWYERACKAVSPAKPARDVRVVHVVRVFCLSELGRYVEAHKAIVEAEQWLAEHPNEGVQLTLLLNRSQLAGNEGDYATMITLADETISLATTLEQEDRVAQGWVNRANGCIYLGRFSEAEAAIEQAIVTATRIEEWLTVARAHCCRGWLLHCQGRLAAALEALREAELGMAQASGEVATMLLETAAVYEQLRQFSEAIASARRAGTLFAEQQMPLYSADAYLRAARMATTQNQPSLARQLLQAAAQQAHRLNQPILQASLALVEATIAAVPSPTSTSRGQRRLQIAARKAAERATQVFEANGLASVAAQGQLILARLDALLGKSSAAIAAYQTLSENSNREVQMAAAVALGQLLAPAEALPYLRRAASLAVEQRRTLPMEELQARYSSETSSYHMQLATCYLTLGDITGAYAAICEAKAGPLLDLRAAANPLMTSERDAVEAAKIDMVRLRKQTDEHMRSARDAMQQAQYERAEHHQVLARQAFADAEDVEHQLTARLRILRDRAGQEELPTFAAIHAAIPVDTALLEYVQLGDDIGCFALLKDAPLTYRRLGSARTLAALLDRWRLLCHRLMHNPRSDGEQEARAVLLPVRAILLDPWLDVLAEIDHLVIAPCGALHQLPWALLNDARRINEQPAITLTPCGAMWATLAPEVDVGSPRLLGFAGDGLSRLNHVVTELGAIAQHLPDAAVVFDACADDLHVSPPPALLHIATHAATHTAAPLCSALELADGPFLLLEAHRLQLRGTRLVTLSACETGVRPEYGDMTLALAGAFLCAGAGAVLASLWRVSDETVAALMEQFYGFMARGLPAARALQQAQLVVQSLHPIDWAAFQLWVGDQYQNAAQARAAALTCRLPSTSR